METDANKYRRIGGTRRIWLGEDHVLLAMRSFCTEYYRRLYFSDIQAVIIRPTPAGKIWSIVLAAGTLMGLGGLLAGGAHPAFLAGPVIGAMLLAGNIALGATCQCHVRTAVGMHQVPTASRMRSAERFGNAVGPLVVRVQGELPDGALQQVGGVPPAPASGGAAARPAWGQPRARQHCAGRGHAALFWVHLASAVVFFGNLADLGAALLILPFVAMIAQLILGIVAAVRQHNTDIPPGLRLTVWLTIAYVVVMGMLVFAGAVEGVQTPPGTVVSWLRAYNMLGAAASGALGLAGFLQLAVFRREFRHRRRARSSARSGTE